MVCYVRDVIILKTITCIIFWWRRHRDIHTLTVQEKKDESLLNFTEISVSAGHGCLHPTQAPNAYKGTARRSPCSGGKSCWLDPVRGAGAGAGGPRPCPWPPQTCLRRQPEGKRRPWPLQRRAAVFWQKCSGPNLKSLSWDQREAHRGSGVSRRCQNTWTLLLPSPPRKHGYSSSDCLGKSRKCFSAIRLWAVARRKSALSSSKSWCTSGSDAVLIILCEQNRRFCFYFGKC